ncbi:MAG: hypothetical protein HZC02_01850 [Candidatus Levybacteria bacterium]|nr:hypothetical protein [Candidatus Levybacteria bacterium]
MRFEISRSLNGNKVTYIARDTNGIVRLRADSVEALQEAIKQYNDALLEQSHAKKTKTKIDLSDNEQPQTTNESDESIVTSVTTVSESTQPETEETSDTSAAPEEKKEFLTNDAKKQTDERRRKTSSKSFWDKLK